MIVPTLNERDNIAPLLAKLAAALDGLAWEAVFVDDDSKDGTGPCSRSQRRLPRMRALRRIGRRGLASACIEGMLATSAPYLAVIDADLQHDEPSCRPCSPRSRQGGWTPWSARASRGAAASANAPPAADQPAGPADQPGHDARRAERPDERVLRDRPRVLRGGGAPPVRPRLQAAARSVRLGAAPGALRRDALPLPSARHGESKVDAPVLLEYVVLLGDKLLGRHLPVRFVLFVLVGLFGVVVHLAAFALCFRARHPVRHSQVVATVVAMTGNFNLNNIFTYRDRRLRGRDRWSATSRFIWSAASG